MTTATAWRRDVARTVARAYAHDPGVAAVILTGSTARGHADRFSDIEVAVVWTRDPQDHDRASAVRRAGGDLHRLYPPDGGLWEDTFFVGRADTQAEKTGVLVEVVNVRAETVKRTLDGALLSFDPDEGRLAFTAAIRDGVPLYGHDLVGAWQDRTREYPDGLVRAVVRRYAPIDHFWRWEMYAERGENLPLLQALLAGVQQRILHTLLALNREYYFGFKWLNVVLERLRIAPEDFGARLRNVNRLDPAEAALELSHLVDETYDLIEQYAPGIPADEIARMRQFFHYRRIPWDEPPPHMTGVSMDTPTDQPRLYLNAGAPSLQKHPDTAPVTFHQSLPGYAPTPLVRAPRLAAALGIREAWVKDESSRLGLPAYKILGASWATYRELETRFGPFSPWSTPDDLSRELRDRAPRPLTLVTATDGNHGRAVARVARWLGLAAHVLVPEAMVPPRIRAIQDEGARVDVIAGTYDDAVEAAARLEGPGHLVISDTSWDGYVRVPGWIVEGYGTIFHEIDEQLAAIGERQPDLVAVQMGVGSLAAAVVRHYRAPERSTRVVGVEPTRADCVLRSLLAGQMTEAPGPHDSIMAGLNCGHTSPLAWPLLRDGLNASLAIPDDRAMQAMRLLALDGVVSGESGAAGAGGLLELLTGPRAPELREALDITEDSRVLVISTEGATDPDAYARIVPVTEPG